MKPSLGRTVIYTYQVGASCEHNNGAKECPAIIVRVWSDNCVNLKLIEDGTDNHWKTSVLQADEHNRFGVWRWPERV